MYTKLTSVSGEWLLFTTNWTIFSYVIGKQVTFRRDDDDDLFVLDQHGPSCVL